VIEESGEAEGDERKEERKKRKSIYRVYNKSL
jgi:hypothetical protein